jgi:hypothetical protein
MGTERSQGRLNAEQIQEIKDLSDELADLAKKI